MNDYEAQREARIAENKRRLQELVGGCLLPVAPVVEPATTKKGRLERATEDLPARERSARLAGKPAPVYALPDERDDDERPKRTRASNGGGGGERGLYGVEGARTCHSCRQKTLSVKAECTSCVLLWCQACLRTRYNESARDVNNTGSWQCPKCRGACICSACMRKSGRVPTGVMAPQAVGAGFSSVFEFLRSNERI